jgi:hypothetical protein
MIIAYFYLKESLCCYIGHHKESLCCTLKNLYARCKTFSLYLPHIPLLKYLCRMTKSEYELHLQDLVNRGRKGYNTYSAICMIEDLSFAAIKTLTILNKFDKSNIYFTINKLLVNERFDISRPSLLKGIKELIDEGILYYFEKDDTYAFDQEKTGYYTTAQMKKLLNIPTSIVPLLYRPN